MLLRIVLLAFAIRAGLQVIGLASVTVQGSGSAAGSFLELWSHWDADHYLRLAEAGYRSEGEDGLFIVFFPGYPVAVAVLGLVLRNLILSGLAVSFVASVAAAWLLYKLVRLDAPHDEAWRAVVLLFAFPTAYFLAAPYSESLFLAVTLAAVYLARRGRLVPAGLAAAGAVVTRLAGIALGPALIAEGLLGSRSRTERIRRTAPAALAGLGLLGYLALNVIVHGDPFAFLDIQRSHWHQQPVPPWTSLSDAASAAAAGTSGDFTIIHWGRLAGATFAIVVLVAGVRRLRVADQVYAWAGLLLVLSASWLISLPRYLLAIYPLFIVLARVASREYAYKAMVVGGVGAQTWFFWRYAAGAWTF